MIALIRRWRERRDCFHHALPTRIPNSGVDLEVTVPATSFIRSRLVDLGRRKMFWCTVCHQTWIV